MLALVCSDCKGYFVACTIKRKVRAIARIHINTIREDMYYPGDIFGDLIGELNQLTEWEEAAHLASAQRWFRDHQKTGYGFSCDEATAELRAYTMAYHLVQIHEEVVWGAYVVENLIIDAIGWQQRKVILDKILELKAEMED